MRKLYNLYNEYIQKVFSCIHSVEIKWKDVFSSSPVKILEAFQFSWWVLSLLLHLVREACQHLLQSFVCMERSF